MMLGRLLAGAFQKSLKPALSKEVTGEVSNAGSLIPSSFGTFWNATAVRTKVRYYFPRPNERMRLRKHGWLTRMSTPSGRRIIMNRILKGKTVLTH